MDAPLRGPARAGFLVALLVLGAVASTLVVLPSPAAAAGPRAAPLASASSSITGNLTGPSLLGTNANATFYLNVSGGPAFTSAGFVGEINYTSVLIGANTTGTSITPANGTISNGTSQPIHLTVTAGAVVETLTLTVEVNSTLGSTNATANFSKTIQLVTPFVVHATLRAGPNAAVLPFNVSVALDGHSVGVVTVPRLAPNTTYSFSFAYAVRGLSSGYHTFTLSVADAHGFVTFANGATVQSTTFYVAPAPANNTVWYVAGVVAFFGVLFIYATRVAARRRPPTRR